MKLSLCCQALFIGKENNKIFWDLTRLAKEKKIMNSRLTVNDSGELLEALSNFTNYSEVIVLSSELIKDQAGEVIRKIIEITGSYVVLAGDLATKDIIEAMSARAINNFILPEEEEAVLEVVKSLRKKQKVGRVNFKRKIGGGIE